MTTRTTIHKTTNIRQTQKPCITKYFSILNQGISIPMHHPRGPRFLGLNGGMEHDPSEPPCGLRPYAIPPPTNTPDISTGKPCQNKSKNTSNAPKSFLSTDLKGNPTPSPHVDLLHPAEYGTTIQKFKPPHSPLTTPLSYFRLNSTGKHTGTPSLGHSLDKHTSAGNPPARGVNGPSTQYSLPLLSTTQRS